jgi:hypothetical protein
MSPSILSKPFYWFGLCHVISGTLCLRGHLPQTNRYSVLGQHCCHHSMCLDHSRQLQSLLQQLWIPSQHSFPLIFCILPLCNGCNPFLLWFPSQGQHYFVHQVNNILTVGVLSDPVFTHILTPDSPFVTVISFHLCQHSMFSHTQSFIFSVDVWTGWACSEPTDELFYYVILLAFSFQYIQCQSCLHNSNGTTPTGRPKWTFSRTFTN